MEATDLKNEPFRYVHSEYPPCKGPQGLGSFKCKGPGGVAAPMKLVPFPFVEKPSF